MLSTTVCVNSMLGVLAHLKTFLHPKIVLGGKEEELRHFFVLAWRACE